VAKGGNECGKLKPQGFCCLSSVCVISRHGSAREDGIERWFFKMKEVWNDF